MKFSQIAAIVVTLIISLGVVMWLASTVPATVFEDQRTETKTTSTSVEESYPTEDGVHQSNPFEIAEEGAYPKAVLNEELFNFGRMALGQKGTHEFIIKNEGDVPLQLAKGPVQCKCTISGLKQETVPPGEEAVIELEYEPKSLGEFGQGAVIWTNDPELSEIHIRVEGTMVKDVEVVPSNGWTLGAIGSVEPVKLEGGIYSSLDDSFEILSIETSSEAVELNARPMTFEEREEFDALAGYKLTGFYHPPEDAGAVNEFVKVETSLENHPNFHFDVTGNRSGPVAIIGPGWTAGNRTLDLGRFSTEKGKQHRLTFMIEAPEEPYEIGEIKTVPSFVKVSLKAEKNAPDAKRHRHTFLLEVPPGTPKGLWNEANPGQITIQSTHPKLESIDLKLMLTIQ